MADIYLSFIHLDQEMDTDWLLAIDRIIGCG